MATLRLVLDRLLDEHASGTRRYAQCLAEAVIRRSPYDCDVTAILPKVTPDEVDLVKDAVAGLTEVTQAPVRRDRLRSAWARGFRTASVGGGFIHSPTLLAPLRDISLSGGIDQTVVTVQDATALTNPKLLTGDEVRWQKAMLARAYRYASAIVTPTNAVADELLEHYPFGDRLRVISGAAAPSIRLPETEEEADSIAEKLGLPDDYIITMASLAPRHGLEYAIRALGKPGLESLKLVVVGPDSRDGVTLHDIIAKAGVPAYRVIGLSNIPDESLAVALHRASALIVPSLTAGFGIPIVEAFHFGTPVVHTDVPALREVSMDAAIVVEREDLDGLAGRISDAVLQILTDSEVEKRLRIAGRDRGHIYNWDFAGDQVWHLHADL